MRFSLVIFDLDGTLVHSLPDIRAALNTGLGELGRPALDEEVVRSLVGDGVVALARKALTVTTGPAAAEPPSEAEVGQLAARVRAIYRQRPCQETTVFAGIVETLRALQELPERRLAVLTNKPGEVTRPLLDALQLTPYFHAIVGDGDGYPRKPDPAAVRALATRFGVTAEQTLMVGDGLPDLAVARAAPCAAAAVLWGYTPAADLRAQHPQFVIAQPAELLTIV